MSIILVPPLTPEQKQAIDEANTAYQCGECNNLYRKEDLPSLSCDNAYCPIKQLVPPKENT